MKHLKKQAINFLIQFKITYLNVHTLSEAISQQVYTIVEYSRISNQDDVEQLLHALGVKALSLTTGAFTYADKNHRILFIEEDRSYEEQLLLLAHEEGHIFCGHLKTHGTITGQDVLNEHEANTFAHYLLDESLWRTLRVYASVYKFRALLISLLLATVLAVGSFCGIYFYGKTSGGEYCRTPNGQKYHLDNCYWVKGHRLTYGSQEDFERAGIEPCSVCIGIQ